MLISKEYGVIFIHIPKTGGTTLTTAFREVLKEDTNILSTGSQVLQRRTINQPSKFPDFYNRVHLKYKYLDERQNSPMETGVWLKYFNSYRIFTAMRNPWGWYVSNYLFDQKIHTTKPNYITRPSTILPFDEWLKTRDTNQFDWVIDSNGKNCATMIGQTETLQDSFNQMCDEIGVPSIQLENLNVSDKSLQEDGSIDHSYYRDFYTEETKAIVAEKSKRVIEQFNYEF